MPRKTLKEWLSAANGWQRIWFVASALMFLYFCVLFPISESGEGSTYRYRIKWAIEAEMKKQECASFMSQPFSQLAEPEFDATGKDGCYNIYMHRKYLENNKPITEKEYLSSFEYEYWERLLGFAGMGLLIAVVLSALLYGIGAVVSWVINGFKKANSNEQ